MKAMTPSFTRENRDAAIAALLGAILVGGSWASGSNRNLLLLMIVWAMFTVGSSLLRTPARVAALMIFCGALLRFPLEIPAVKFIDPGPVDPDGVALATLSIPPGQVWEYVFAVDDLPHLERQCGPLQGTLFLDGIRLSEATVNIRMTGAQMLEPALYLKAYAYDEIQLKPDLRDVREFRIALSAVPGARPALKQAPEARAGTIFSDAIFLELKSPTCNVLYHPLRRIQTT